MVAVQEGYGWSRRVGGTVGEERSEVVGGAPLEASERVGVGYETSSDDREVRTSPSEQGGASFSSDQPEGGRTMIERRTAFIDPMRMNNDDYSEQTPIAFPEKNAPASENVVTSMIAEGMHAVTLDIDYPCAVVPSSTPGHFHLYIDKPLTEYEYDLLLGTLAEIGLIGRGYYEHSRVRGFTVVRMPWVNKTPPVADVGEPSVEEKF